MASSSTSDLEESVISDSQSLQSSDSEDPNESEDLNELKDQKMSANKNISLRSIPFDKSIINRNSISQKSSNPSNSTS